MFVRSNEAFHFGAGGGGCKLDESVIEIGAPETSMGSSGDLIQMRDRFTYIGQLVPIHCALDRRPEQWADNSRPWSGGATAIAPLARPAQFAACARGKRDQASQKEQAVLALARGQPPARVPKDGDANDDRWLAHPSQRVKSAPKQPSAARLWKQKALSSQLCAQVSRANVSVRQDLLAAGPL